jgi:glyoxylase-like metal-dependent hydrolase (beta-lactamase superfamily II)
MSATHPSVTLIDCHYVTAEKAAAFLIVEGNSAAFVDNNTNYAVPRLLDALKKKALSEEQVEFIIVTHVHLDHAGGTAELLRHCPNATVLAHPKAARHLIDPSRLVAGAKSVYGEETFESLYGTIEGVPEGRIRIIEDGESLVWGERTLQFFYTKGHASHHFCIHDSGSDGVFSGDAFGMGRMPSVRPGVPFTVCSSAPAEFDPEEARRSVQKVLDTGASRAFITHYGHFDNLERQANQLLHSIAQMEAIGREAAASDATGDDLFGFCRERVISAFKEHLEYCDVEDHEADLDWLEGDVFLNSLGLRFYAERIRASK